MKCHKQKNDSLLKINHRQLSESEGKSARQKQNNIVSSHYKEPEGLFFNSVRIVFLFFFSFILISWRLITLQYCSGFCHTLT